MGRGGGVDLSPTHPAAVVSAALLLLDTLLCCKATLPHWKADAEQASEATSILDICMINLGKSSSRLSVRKFKR